MTWGYGTLATEVYDLDKPIGSSFGDVEYYTDALAEVTGPVLEPAVGTGRILIPLLASGHEMEGYDTSPEMLALCRERCQEHDLQPALYEADMTSFVQPSHYSAVVIPSGSITLLNGRDALLSALRCFHQSLQPGGRLIVDVPAPELSLDPPAMRSWSCEGRIWTLQTMKVEYDSARNQTLQWLRYERWDDGRLQATELQLFRLQHWSLTEFAALLGECGFTQVLVSADHVAENSPQAHSALWTFHALRD